MAHGLAIVATTVGLVPEVISDGETGMLVLPESVEALAQAMARVIADRDFRGRLGRNAREKFEAGPYNEAACIAGVLASYNTARNAAVQRAPVII